MNGTPSLMQPNFIILDDFKTKIRHGFHAEISIHSLEKEVLRQEFNDKETYDSFVNQYMQFSLNSFPPQSTSNVWDPLIDLIFDQKKLLCLNKGQKFDVYQYTQVAEITIHESDEVDSNPFDAEVETNIVKTHIKIDSYMKSFIKEKTESESQKSRYTGLRHHPDGFTSISRCMVHNCRG